MFYDCSALTSLDISGWDTGKVTSVYYMFFNCRALISLNLSGWNTSKVTTMNGMFALCSALTTIYASSKWTTSNVTKSSDMFKGCTKLKGDITFDPNYTDKTYAKVSGGYLTLKSAA